jgi:hypothetical protein
LELTETAFLQDKEYAAAALDELHRQGMSIAVDDSGTGLGADPAAAGTVGAVIDLATRSVWSLSRRGSRPRSYCSNCSISVVTWARATTGVVRYRQRRWRRCSHED